MQIGYGPDRNGEFHPKAVEALQEVGEWLGINAEAIYSTRAFPTLWNDSVTENVRWTASKVKGTVYGTYLQDLSAQSSVLPPKITVGCVAKAAKVFLLGLKDDFTRKPIALNFSSVDLGTEILIPKDLTMLPKGPGFSFKFENASITSNC